MEVLLIKSLLLLLLLLLFALSFEIIKASNCSCGKMVPNSLELLKVVNGEGSVHGFLEN